MAYTKAFQLFAVATICAGCGCPPAAVSVRQFADLDAATNHPVHLEGRYQDEWKSGPTVVVFGTAVHLEGDVDTNIPGFTPSAGAPNPTLDGATVTVDGTLMHYTQPPTDSDYNQNVPSHFYVEHARLRLIRRPGSTP
jgi:hypothetical protein